MDSRAPCHLEVEECFLATDQTKIYISESFGIFRLDILACPDGTEPVGEILFNHDMRKTLD